MKNCRESQMGGDRAGGEGTEEEMAKGLEGLGFATEVGAPYSEEQGT